MYWCHKYSTKGRFPINQILFNQKFFNTSSFTEKQCLPKTTRCQSYYKRHTNRTNLGNIMKPRDGYISYKIYRQISFRYQMKYPIFDKFYYWSIWTYCTDFWVQNELCKRKIHWDQFLPLHLIKYRQKWQENLPDTQNITLDRWRGSTDTDIKLQVFTDASKIGHGVACYFRFKAQN